MSGLLPSLLSLKSLQSGTVNFGRRIDSNMARPTGSLIGSATRTLRSPHRALKESIVKKKQIVLLLGLIALGVVFYT